MQRLSRNSLSLPSPTGLYPPPSLSHWQLQSRSLANILNLPSMIDDTASTTYIYTNILEYCRAIAIAQESNETIFNQFGITVEIRTECKQCNKVKYETEKADTIRGLSEIENRDRELNKAWAQGGGGKGGEGVDVAAATFWSIDSWATVQELEFDCPGCHNKISLV